MKESTKIFEALIDALEIEVRFGELMMYYRRLPRREEINALYELERKISRLSRVPWRARQNFVSRIRDRRRECLRGRWN